MSAPLALGIDIGGTRVRVALVDRGGGVTARREVRTAARAGPAEVVEQILSLARELTSGLAPGTVGGCGVSCPGPLDTVTGVALGVPTLAGWVDIPIRMMLSEALGLPVTIENDGIAAAHGEWRFGAGWGLQSLVYVTVSTGIGGGVIVDGRLLHGRRGMAGHVGHMTIVADGDACPCGNRGCFEAYASGTAFQRRIAAKAPSVGLPPDSGPADIFALAREGNSAALGLVAEQGDLLGIGFANLLHLYSPDAIVVGGGIGNGLDLLMPSIAARLQCSAMPAFRDVPVIGAGLGENSGLVGAAALAFSPETV